MSQFENVTVTKEANVYFDGKVTSRAITFADGTKKTLGIMLPGVYQFNTDAKELMEILSGDLEVLLPGNDDWVNQFIYEIEVLKYDVGEFEIEFISRDFFDIAENSDSKDEIIERLSILLKESVLKRCPDGRFGILFSGGIDSTILAYLCKLNGFFPILYTGSFHDGNLSESKDLFWAKQIAEYLGFELQSFEVDIDLLENYIGKVISIIESTDVIKVGVALPFGSVFESLFPFRS